jgi:hypothetical protein
VGKLEEGKNSDVNLLKALLFLKKAWDSVKGETIRNCFKKAGFNKEVSTYFLFNIFNNFLGIGRNPLTRRPRDC